MAVSGSLGAGITGGGPFDEMPADDFDLLVDTHFGGAVRVSRAAWPHLKASGGEMTRRVTIPATGAVRLAVTGDLKPSRLRRSGY